MADEIKDAKDGLQVRLETISGLRVYDHFPSNINEFPCAVIGLSGRTASGPDGVALAGSSFIGLVTVTLLIAKAVDLEGMDEVVKYCEPLGALSVEAAIDADNSWNSQVDHGRLLRIENVGRKEVNAGWYWGADFVCDFTKQVLT